MKFTKNRSSALDINLHLHRVNLEFNPPLNTVVNIDEYATKIFCKAQRVETWDDINLIALIAFYMNSLESYIFITNVSVEKDFQGKKIAKKLMEKVVHFKSKFQLNKIKLEVHKQNNNAISFYEKLNFEIITTNKDYILMEYKTKL